MVSLSNHEAGRTSQPLSHPNVHLQFSWLG
jgi:hypothetical protein